ncbi:penicillin-binding protein 1C [Maribius pontilimi]|uniref:peptidoglycan glycosyltransferase n=1 Tax=Palleronia pontilimi TaxID=1964209 RepID=A0A934MHH6_9RHOB|nr:penicillin-binding protein 1C [Palleronia pontilimi]MBJ3763324.1 penicillin-binding protein 1C [Palleronia pontilimi]
MRVLALWLAAALFVVALARDTFDAWVAATPVPPLSVEVSVEVVDRDGTLLRAYPVQDGRWRLRTPLASVDPLYLDMLVAWEDRRFHDHGGVDPLAVLRAAGQALRAGRIVSGASTLSMQVARLLESGPTGAWAGKLRQARLAMALERRLTKSQILELYINLAPFGGNLEGVRAASLSWFGKPPARLSAHEAALLVALPQSPETRRPDRFAARAAVARDRVLARMGLPPGPELGPRDMRPLPALAPHVADRAQAAAPGQERIVTTLDAGLQARLESLARKAASQAGDAVSTAIVVRDHATGDTLASVGSPGYRAERLGFVDMTRALRSPGSTLKPLIYGLAFDAGLAHPGTLIADAPTRLGRYAPQNFDGAFRGPVTISEALRLSLNVPAVKVTDALGPARLMAGLERAGASAVVPGGKPGLAVALGGLGLTLDDLVTLYASFARGGIGLDGKRVLSDRAAWHLGDILWSEAAGMAVKTGTSYGHRDAWAIGWDGRYVAGVWIGRADGTPVPGAFGGDVARPLLEQVLSRVRPAPVALPPPPPTTRVGDEVPSALRWFRGDAPDAVASGPTIAFPPEGARLTLRDASLPTKVEGGRPPFTWLLDGAPVAVGVRDRQAVLPGVAPGFARVSVIDGAGQAASARVRVD